jgi:hypothetical protein
VLSLGGPNAPLRLAVSPSHQSVSALLCSALHSWLVSFHHFCFLPINFFLFLKPMSASNSVLSQMQSPPTDLFDENTLLPKTVPHVSTDINDISLERAKELASSFYHALDSPNYQYRGACAVCGMVKFYNEMGPNTYSKQSNFFAKVSYIFLDTFDSSDKVPVCHSCLNSLQSNKVPKFSLFNMGNIPSAIPLQLQCLEVFERLLVSTARPYITLKRLKFGKFAYSGNSVTVTQKVTEALTELPMSIEEFSNCVTISICKTSSVSAYSKLNAWRFIFVQVHIITNNKFIVFNRRSAHRDEMTIDAADTVHNRLLEVATDLLRWAEARAVKANQSEVLSIEGVAYSVDLGQQHQFLLGAMERKDLKKGFKKRFNLYFETFFKRGLINPLQKSIW